MDHSFLNQWRNSRHPIHMLHGIKLIATCCDNKLQCKRPFGSMEKQRSFMAVIPYELHLVIVISSNVLAVPSGFSEVIFVAFESVLDVMWWKSIHTSIHTNQNHLLHQN